MVATDFVCGSDAAGRLCCSDWDRVSNIVTEAGISKLSVVCG